MRSGLGPLGYETGSVRPSDLDCPFHLGVRAGVVRHDLQPMTRLYASCVAEQKGRRETGGYNVAARDGWAYYGEQFLEYILGRKVTLPYRWIYCLLIPFGAVIRPEVVWAWGDLMNALQVFPNLVGLVGLSGIAAMYAKERT